MGYPDRHTRAQLGPPLEDAYPVENPRQQVGAATRNLVFWQGAGMNLIVPRSSCHAKWNTGSSLFDIHHQAEAWNPDGAQAHPVLARTSAGIYTYTFVSAYNDENGIARSLTLIDARVFDPKVLTAFSDRLEARAWINAGVNPLVVQIRLWDTGGTAVDEAFWLEVF